MTTAGSDEKATTAPLTDDESYHAPPSEETKPARPKLADWPLQVVHHMIASLDPRFRLVNVQGRRRAGRGETVAHYWARQPFTPDVTPKKLKDCYPYRDAEPLPDGRVTLRLKFDDPWHIGADVHDAHARAVADKLVRTALELRAKQLIDQEKEAPK